MDSGKQAVFAVREEHARIGGIEVAQKTVIAATDEGIMQTQTVTRQPAPLPGSVITTETTTVETVRTVPQVVQPALPVLVVNQPPKERTWKDWCFECDDSHEWYSPNGKGICWILLLLLAYLVIGAAVGAIIIAWFILACFLNSDDD